MISFSFGQRILRLFHIETASFQLTTTRRKSSSVLPVDSEDDDDVELTLLVNEGLRNNEMIDQNPFSSASSRATEVQSPDDSIPNFRDVLRYFLMGLSESTTRLSESAFLDVSCLAVAAMGTIPLDAHVILITIIRSLLLTI